MTTTSMMTSPLSFDDIFHELNNELETEANDWHLNNFYINIEDEIQNEELNRSGTHQQQQQSQVLSISQKKTNEDNDDHHLFFHQIPDYLSPSNSSFRVKFFSELRNIYNPINFHDLQQLSYLMHQISIIHLHEQLWYRCLQSGTGQLKQRQQSLTTWDNTNITYSYWPEMVTSMMRSKGMININNEHDKIDQDLYIHFVKNYLNQLEKKVNQCRLEFDTIKKRLPSVSNSDTLIDKIEHFIQNEGLISMRLHFEIRIALIEYIYTDRLYQLEYFHLKPNELQIQLAKRICSLTYDNEKAQQELIFFRLGILYKKLPDSLNILEVSLPTSITTISDTIIRERLSNQYITIIQQAKVDLTKVLTAAAEAKRDDCQKNFKKQTHEIWNNQHQLPIDQQLTTTMLTLIDQRQKNIIECLKSIYHLKDEFLLRAPRTTSLS